MFKPAVIFSALEILGKTLRIIWKSKICHDNQGFGFLGEELLKPPLPSRLTPALSVWQPVGLLAPHTSHNCFQSTPQHPGDLPRDKALFPLLVQGRVRHSATSAIDVWMNSPSPVPPHRDQGHSAGCRLWEGHSEHRCSAYQP